MSELLDLAAGKTNPRTEKPGNAEEGKKMLREAVQQTGADTYLVISFNGAPSSGEMTSEIRLAFFDAATGEKIESSGRSVFEGKESAPLPGSTYSMPDAEKATCAAIDKTASAAAKCLPGH